MARNGNNLASAATTKAATPDELYDTLNETQQEVFDLIGSMGFRPDRDEDNRWFALARIGDAKVGPKATLSDLAEAVQKFLADSASSANGNGDAPVIQAEKLTQNSKGDKYLPGMEPVVDKDLAAAITTEFADKRAWNDAGKKKKESKMALEAMAKAKRELFRPDPDNSDSLIYRAGDILCRIKKDFTVAVKTEEIKSSEDED